jgi:hypothetical protein
MLILSGLGKVKRLLSCMFLNLSSFDAAGGLLAAAGRGEYQNYLELLKDVVGQC